ncbi:MAG: 23S rRNA (pseudouridine(1915)-N(3))-methyltransferase RlmH [Bacilli bacterium]|jgi:23S rRNA (pseudouridine1915-N3)-methyltransferase
MKIKIIAVGKIKEHALRILIKEYEKRLKPYTEIEIIEIPDLPIPKNSSPKEEEQILEKESIKIEKNIEPYDYVIALDLEGESFDSESFSVELMKMFALGNACLTFLIGSSLGLSPTIRKRAQRRISFSKMTFPHQLMRLILLEQVYRAFRIAKNEPYHK